MGNYINIKNKGFDKRPENINRKGRPISIKQDLKNILETKGEINIKAENIISINKNGSVTVKMPTSESLAMKLLQIASSGKNSGSANNLNEVKTKVLKGRNVVLFPDLGCFDLWNNKIENLTNLATFRTSTLLETKATETEKRQGLDIADYLTKIKI